MGTLLAEHFHDVLPGGDPYGWGDILLTPRVPLSIRFVAKADHNLMAEVCYLVSEVLEVRVVFAGDYTGNRNGIVGGIRGIHLDNGSLGWRTQRAEKAVATRITEGGPSSGRRLGALRP